MYHLSAYGRSGPRRDDPGFARVAEAYSGLTYASGDPDGPPMFSGYAIADGVAGVHGAFAVMLALHEVQRTGRGQFVELSLAGAMLRLPYRSATPGAVHHAGPERGDHTAEVLSDLLAMTDEEVEALTDAGVVARGDR